jgi:hypothetical protein
VFGWSQGHPESIPQRMGGRARRSPQTTLRASAFEPTFLILKFQDPGTCYHAHGTSEKGKRSSKASIIQATFDGRPPSCTRSRDFALPLHGRSCRPAFSEQLTASPSAGERRPRRATSSARRHLHCDGRSRRLSRGLEKPREHIKMHRVASRKRWRCTCLTVAEQSGVAAWSNDAMRVDFVQQHRTWAS